MTSAFLLDQISSPEDLKKLSYADLSLLAEQMRHKIIAVLKQTGGHLASNLGIIELTIALHYVFSSPEDKFIFDVGHQAYPHKLITGRNDAQFDRIRHDHGLSGFTSPLESPHDLFFSGHAGNALSLALGMAKATPPESRSHILPILGDAAFSCGLTLEALNNIRSDLSKFIVILNDNNMSISQNVGVMSQSFSRWIHHPKMSSFSKKMDKWLVRIPRYGTGIAKQWHRLSLCLKSLFCPIPIFEQFGLAYVGPIDGHNIKKLISVLRIVRDLPFPILLHVCTTKGKGLEIAQENPSKYHGVSANFTTHEENTQLPVVKQPPTYPDIFGETLCQLGTMIPNLHVVTPAMSLGSRLEKFKTNFPERFIDVGIAEGHAVTLSAGISKAQVPVICSIYSTFLQRAIDNVFHDVCMQNLPVILAIDRAGLAYADGCSHHGIYDLGILRMMPNMVICQPRSAVVLQQLLFSAISWNSPTAIRYPNIPALQKDPLSVDVQAHRTPGVGEILTQGEDILIIALGHMCSAALSIQAQLLKHGISATVVDPVFIKPFDNNLFGVLLMHHTRVVVIEEHAIRGGLGSEFNDFLATYSFKIDVLHFAIPDTFVYHGDKESLQKKTGLHVETMVKRILTHFNFRAIPSFSSHLSTL
ncbi:1-deoxy-D-xylulose-5-phosphate synthase [Chlamydia gallinacea]|uniref:1-deoxy-D-xylulose-5-phosphate synthase n=2 Tax=Chlamydia gallinacea TaxID=1457153 RepID=A0A173DZL6_9CHLA|nr:1-deoxy-D-xylulose-5-phosphate synthase [Chlamydia gallinacea]ANG66347.1 1-deoxy-D-xylulose-5-phosphate synthase [Chlamydia gallinacea 08-1274/3]EYE62977.1 1-deoxy-D-xylulose-5-phosphate synthase [Bacteroides fragilis str. S6L5]MBX6680440.1 1-deoxy-D-xylulose-5-phosphate synthase [Chlamydia gallinacea]MBX6687067.1 1-deoxy-D-xylulose-5-phosphate synthase [Chlamydia gallinacea]